MIRLSLLLVQKTSGGIVLDGFPAEVPAFPYPASVAARMPNMLSW